MSLDTRLITHGHCKSEEQRFDSTWSLQVRRAKIWQHVVTARPKSKDLTARGHCKAEEQRFRARSRLSPPRQTTYSILSFKAIICLKCSKIHSRKKPDKWHRLNVQATGFLPLLRIRYSPYKSADEYRLKILKLTTDWTSTFTSHPWLWSWLTLINWWKIDNCTTNNLSISSCGCDDTAIYGILTYWQRKPLTQTFFPHVCGQLLPWSLFCVCPHTLVWKLPAFGWRW